MLGFDIRQRSTLTLTLEGKIVVFAAMTLIVSL